MSGVHCQDHIRTKVPLGQPPAVARRRLIAARSVRAVGVRPPSDGCHSALSTVATGGCIEKASPRTSAAASEVTSCRDRLRNLRGSGPGAWGPRSLLRPTLFHVQRLVTPRFGLRPRRPATSCRPGAHAGTGVRRGPIGTVHRPRALGPDRLTGAGREWFWLCVRSRAAVARDVARGTAHRRASRSRPGGLHVQHHPAPPKDDPNLGLGRLLGHLGSACGCGWH